MFRFLEVLFIINGIIANESLDKRRQPLLELSVSGRDEGHYLWLLTKSYTDLPINLQKQTKVVFVWYLKEPGDLKVIQEENDVPADNELFVARYGCLYIRNKYLRGFRMLNHARGAYFK